MNDNCAESCGKPSRVITLAVYVLCIIRPSDPSRLKMAINKIEVFVYSSADSTGGKRAAEGMTML